MFIDVANQMIRPVSLLISLAMSQLTALTTQIIGFSVNYVSAVGSCKNIVLGTAGSGVKIELTNASIFRPFPMGGSTHGYDSAISEDQQLVVLAGDGAYVKQYDSASANYIDIILLSRTGSTHCLQTKISPDKNLLFIRWDSNTIQIYKNTGSYTSVANLIGLPATVQLMVVAEISLYDLLLVYDMTNFVKRYRPPDASYSSFTEVETINIPTGLIAASAQGAAGLQLALASNSNFVYVYGWSGSIYTLTQTITSTVTIGPNNCRVKISPDGRLLALYGVGVMTIYLRNSSGQFNLVQTINSVTINSFLLCNQRLQLYFGSSRAQYFGCTVNYLFKTSCVPVCPRGYEAVVAVFKQCRQCLFDEQLSTCVSSCRVTYFAGPTLLCQKCQDPCLTCISLAACIFCKGYMDGLVCVPNCIYPKANDGLTGSCVICTTYYFQFQCFTTCPPGSYPVPGLCQSCLPQCVTCNTPTGCLACKPPLLLFNSTCTNDCPPGTYGLLNQCKVCPAGCLACELKCSSCSLTLNLFNGTCVQSCPQKHFSLNSLCLPQQQSLSLVSLKTKGFLFPSADKQIELLFSHQITQAQFISQFRYGQFVPTFLNSTRVKLIKVCPKQSFSSTFTLHIQPATNYRPFSQSLLSLILSLNYSCFQIDAGSQLILSQTQAALLKAFNLSLVGRTFLSLGFPSSLFPLFLALKYMSSLPSPVLILYNLLSLPIQPRIATWRLPNSFSGRMLAASSAVSDQFQLLLPLFHASLQILVLVLGILIRKCQLLGWRGMGVASFINIKTTELNYFILLFCCLTRAQPLALATSAIGFLLCLAALGFQQVSLQLFLNEPLTSQTFWQQHTVFLSTNKYRRPVLESTYFGHEIYYIFSLTLKSTILSSTLLIDSIGIYISIALDLLLGLSLIAVLIYLDPFSNRLLKIAESVKISATVAIIVGSLCSTLALEPSSSTYSVLGWLVFLFFFILILLEIATGLTTYIYYLTVDTQTIKRKVTDYHTKIITDGQCSLQVLNLIIVDCDLNGWNCEQQQTALVPVVVITSYESVSQVKQVVAAVPNPQWQFYKHDNYRAQIRERLLANSEHQSFRQFLTQKYGSKFNSAKAEIYSLLRLDQRVSRIQQFECSQCLISISGTAGVKQLRFNKVPTAVTRAAGQGCHSIK